MKIPLQSRPRFWFALSLSSLVFAVYHGWQEARHWFPADVGPEAGLIRVYGQSTRWRPRNCGSEMSGRDLEKRYGLVDRTGKEVVPLQWEYLWEYDSAGMARFTVGQDQNGWVNRSGEVVLPPPLFSHPSNDGPEFFDSQGWLLVQRFGQWGWIDRQGNTVLPFDWDDATEFDQRGLAKVMKGNSWRYIDRRGQRIAVPAKEKDEPAKEKDEFDAAGMKRVEQAKQFGFVNRAGDVVIPVEWDWLSDFDPHGWATAKRNQKFGFINRQGEIVIPVEFDACEPFDTEGFAQVSRGGRSGCINRKGEVVIPLEWDRLENFDTQGWAAVERNNKWGFIDRQGELMVPLEYDACNPFAADGLAHVSRDGLTGLINRMGEVVIPLEWYFIRPFSQDGWAQVTRQNKVGWIDRTGQVVIPVVWDAPHSECVDSAFDEHGLAVVQQGLTCCLINRHNVVIIPGMWNELWKQDGGYHAWRPAPTMIDQPFRWLAEHLTFLPQLDPKYIDAHLDRTGRIIWQSDWRARHRTLGLWSLAFVIGCGVMACKALRRLHGRPLGPGLAPPG